MKERMISVNRSSVDVLGDLGKLVEVFGLCPVHVGGPQLKIELVIEELLPDDGVLPKSS